MYVFYIYVSRFSSTINKLFIQYLMYVFYLYVYVHLHSFEYRHKNQELK
jgi:hypothetical protein